MPHQEERKRPTPHPPLLASIRAVILHLYQPLPPIPTTHHKQDGTQRRTPDQLHGHGAHGGKKTTDHPRGGCSCSCSFGPCRRDATTTTTTPIIITALQQHFQSPCPKPGCLAWMLRRDAGCYLRPLLPGQPVLWPQAPSRRHAMVRLGGSSVRVNERWESLLFCLGFVA